MKQSYQTPQSYQNSNFPTNSSQIPSNNAQRYVYIDPGRQPYINPAFIQRNQNYYQSPIINNPPARQNVSNYGMYDPYSNYYNYGSYQNNCGCNGQYNYGYQGQYNYNCGGCQGQSYYGQQYSPYGGYGYSMPSYGSQYGCGCGSNCNQYGLSVNRQRLTPKFPSKLGHSYVTSGQKVQNKLVINQPTVESAPFQTQRRKTYLPFTRKYLEYQDHIQYIPVQKSQWAYKKVMKQIDFVPQQYYETSVQVIPRQKIDHKVRYIPVQQEILHVPNQIMKPQSDLRSTQQRRVTITENKIPQSVIGRQSQAIGHASFVVPARYIPSGTQRPNLVSNQKQVMNNVIEQNRNSSIIHPAESTVQMVPNTRFQPLIQQTSAFVNSNNKFSSHFPSSGGVMIGSSSQTASQNINPTLSSFGPGGGIQFQNKNNQMNIKSSQVIHSGYGNSSFEQNNFANVSNLNKGSQYARNFRQSGRVESQDFNFENIEYKKKNSIVHKFEDEEN